MKNTWQSQGNTGNLKLSEMKEIRECWNFLKSRKYGKVGTFRNRCFKLKIIKMSVILSLKRNLKFLLHRNDIEHVIFILLFIIENKSLAHALWKKTYHMIFIYTC